MAGYSPVAAGGIATFHPSPIAVMLQGNDRLCGSIILSIQDSIPASFDVAIPDLTTRSLRSVPSHSAVWTFLYVHVTVRTENADSNVPRYYTYNENPDSRRSFLGR